MLDLLFNNSLVYDGSGAAPEKRSVGVLNGKIVLDAAPDTAAKETVDGSGLALSPGFIDVHSHSDLYIAREPLRGSRLKQGITTEVGGNCGSCSFPFIPNSPDETVREVYNSTYYRDFETYRRFGNMIPLGANQYTLAGHNRIRSQVMGAANRPATDSELEKMKEMVRLAMEQGAVGLSTGLVYSPGCFTPEEELVELLKVVAEYDGIYASHIRNEADYVEEGLDEAIRLAEKAGLPLQISHLKAMFPQNWNKMSRLLEKIDKARDRGLDITFDVYPYTACSTTSASALPPSFLQMGYAGYIPYLQTKEGLRDLKEKILHPTEFFENPVKALGGDGILITVAPETPEAVGKTLGEYAEMRGLDLIEGFAELIWRNKAAAMDVRFLMNEDNLIEALRSPLCMIGTDGLFRGFERMSHPRALASFPRFLGRYVREKGLMPMEEAIRRITGAAAEHFRIKTKGYIREGYDADLVLFDPETIIDNATYREPLLPNTGIAAVYVGGKPAVKKNELTGIANARICRYKE